MGKGLSDLQKGILMIAYSNRTGDQDSRRKMDVYKTEVILKLYMGRTDLDFNAWHNSQLQRYFHDLSSSEYRSAQAAVARAFARLAARGLVTQNFGLFSKWSGATLTPEGLTVARNYNG